MKYFRTFLSFTQQEGGDVLMLVSQNSYLSN